MKVVIPAAGKGTRLYNITKCLPKEMLPVGNRLICEYVSDELFFSLYKGYNSN